MSETPKRRLLRKSGLQASPFGTPIKTLSLNNDSTPSKPADIITVTPMANPFLVSSNTDSQAATEAPPSPENNSPSRRLTPKRLLPPTTPKTKTILRIGVWGHIVGLKKQDESVWLKDTSTNGTLLNDVLVHDTARPIQHKDIMTIAGRKFRFEAESPLPPLTPLQPTSDNTPGRQSSKISHIQPPIDEDFEALADMPSPSAGKGLSTPIKNRDRNNTAALESALGLFTPNRADKLSRLLVSPKPIPLPAFLAKSPSKAAATTPRRVYVMIDEPSILNPTCSDAPTTDSVSGTIECGLQTPKREKRMASTADFDANGIVRTPKKVSFGPALSPEIFDQKEPPSTPIKRGEQQDQEPESMKEKVSKELELAKLRKQVVVDKPKKTIKKKPLSTKAKLRKEKTLERGLMNTEKDEKRIGKQLEKGTLKKRGKQMWE
ncbi:hypothetical protein BGZ65_001731 [Modicella reniformis]|uniref:PP1-binding domain-containing protein n=1 Tax=Modicella reniformis TaxID=1440133 RepID=A0A9P6SNC2_9FUNG|nr:hypothetical protein BGZ65_001731 [Modicella reniformis]